MLRATAVVHDDDSSYNFIHSHTLMHTGIIADCVLAIYISIGCDVFNNNP